MTSTTKMTTFGSHEALANTTSPATSSAPRATVDTSPAFLAHTAKIERIAETVAEDRALMVDLDRRRAATREALAALRSDSRHTNTTDGSSPTPTQRYWTLSAGLFLRADTSRVTEMLRTDANTLDTMSAARARAAADHAAKLVQLQTP